MAQPTTYSANLVFGGRTDSSLDKAVKQIETQLRQINKETTAFRESVSSIGTGILTVGAAFLGLRTGLDVFEDLADKGAQLSDLTNQLKNNLAGFSSLKEPISSVVSQFETFNEKLRQTVGYSTQITESFENAFTGKGYLPEETMRLTKLLETIDAGRRVKLTPDQAGESVSAMDEAIKSGSQESVIRLNQLLGLKLNPGSLMGVPSTPGNPNQAYGEREAILERALGATANPNAGLEMQRDPRMAGYLLGQEQTEISGRLGTGINELFAPVQQELTKALRDFEGSGELEKFTAWSTQAGANIANFFTKVIEPKLPSALEKLTGFLDKFGVSIDKMANSPAVTGGFVKEIESDMRTIGATFQLIGDVLSGKPLRRIYQDLKEIGATGEGFENQKNRELLTTHAGFTPSPGEFGGMRSWQIDPLQKHLPHMAAGGIVNSPTYSLIGEAGPEAVIPLSFLGAETKDITKANTEATKKETDALTALTQKLEDNLSFLQQGHFQTLGQLPGQIPGQRPTDGSGGGGTGGPPWKRGSGGARSPGNNVSGSIDGVQFTHYGYKGDTTPDWYSAHGIGDHDNKLIEGLSVALTQSERKALFGYTGKSREQKFTMGGHQWEDDDTAPESNRRVDVYDKSNTFLARILGNKDTFKGSAGDSGKSPLDDTLDKAQQALKLGTNRLDDPRIKGKSSEDTSGSTTTPSTTTPTIHYSPHVTINAYGHDANSVEIAVKNALAHHGEELGHHIRRTLQDEYRRDQRVNYA